MPDLHAILTLYELRTSVAASGAPGSDAADVPDDAMRRVALSFLSPNEAGNWDRIGDSGRSALARMGRQRFHRWEMANPDISAVLRRKARGIALG